MEQAGEAVSTDTAWLDDLEPVVRRVVGSRVSGAADVDDIVQETMARLVRARPALEDGALVGYAVSAARNAVVSFRRDQDRRGRLSQRAWEREPDDDPEMAVLAEEDAAAVRQALERLDARERDWLVSHEVSRVPTPVLAEEAGLSTGALAVRMTRARARLRVEYVLALRRLKLPSDDCLDVLLSLSAGDRRRQKRLDAHGHLLRCPTCGDVSEVVVERRRGLAALWPFPATAGALRARRVQAKHLATAGAVGALMVAAGALALRADGRAPNNAVAVAQATLPPATSLPATAVTVGSSAVPAVSTSAPAPVPAPVIPPLSDPALGCRQSVDVAGRAVAIADAGALRSLVGAAVVVTDLVVGDVVADEGFWVGCGGARLWLQLIGPGESPTQVVAGLRVSAEAILLANPAAGAKAFGVDPDEGGAELDAQGVHLAVAYDSIRFG